MWSGCCGGDLKNSGRRDILQRDCTMYTCDFEAEAAADPHEATAIHVKLCIDLLI